jgi:hypothetical protein
MNKITNKIVNRYRPDRSNRTISKHSNEQEIQSKHKLESAVSEQNYSPRTDLGRELLEIRKQAIAAGIKSLSEEELDREISLRKGRPA